MRILLNKKILYLVIILSFFFLILEVAARIYQYQRGRTFDDALYGIFYRDYFFLGPSFKVGAKGSWMNITDMKINSMGFRGEEFSIHKPEKTFRILTFGGSTSHSGNYPENLQKLLQQKNTSDLEYEVINATVPTWNTTQSLIQLITRGIYLDPDVIIIFHAINDWDQDDDKWLRHLPEVDYNKYGGFLARHFILYSFIKNKLSLSMTNVRAYRFSRHQASGKKQAIESMEDHNKNPVSNSNLIYRTNIENFIAIAKSRSILTILVTMPLNYAPDAPDTDNVMRAGYFYAEHNKFKRIVPKVSYYNQILRELADGKDVFTIDVSATSFGNTPDFFVDLCHFSDKGAERFSFLVYEELKKILENDYKNKIANQAPNSSVSHNL